MCSFCEELEKVRSNDCPRDIIYIDKCGTMIAMVDRFWAEFDIMFCPMCGNLLPRKYDLVGRFPYIKWNYPSDGRKTFTFKGLADPRLEGFQISIEDYNNMLYEKHWEKFYPLELLGEILWLEEHHRIKIKVESRTKLNELVECLKTDTEGQINFYKWQQSLKYLQVERLRDEIKDINDEIWLLSLQKDKEQRGEENPL